MIRHRNKQAIDAFRALLRELYDRCGSPPYHELAEISERLDELYPLPQGGKRGLPTLSKSAVSETLNGKRKGLPNASWLAAFVLSCQRRAWELGVIAEDPGPDSLPEWQHNRLVAQGGGTPSRTNEETGQASTRPAQRFRGTTPKDRPSGSPQRRPETSSPGEPGGETGTPPGSSPGRDPDADGPPHPQSLLTGSGAALAAMPSAFATGAPLISAAVLKSAVPVHLSPPLRAYVAGYGPYGRTLLSAAQHRVIEAVHQTAVLLLAADSLHGGAEAHRLLIYAAAADHPDAIKLLDANPVHLDRFDAAGHACGLADAAAADGHPEAAKVFYECASRNGLPIASLKLAEILLAEGKDQQAVRWLAAAAQQGNTTAEIRLETLCRTGRIPPAHPAPPPPRADPTDDGPAALSN